MMISLNILHMNVNLYLTEKEEEKSSHNKLYEAYCL